VASEDRRERRRHDVVDDGWGERELFSLLLFFLLSLPSSPLHTIANQNSLAKNQ
jgi:hypothetical protein